MPAVVAAASAKEKIRAKPVGEPVASGAMLEAFFGHASLFFERVADLEQSSGDVSPIPRGHQTDAKFHKLVRSAACLPAAESKFTLPWPEGVREEGYPESA